MEFRIFYKLRKDKDWSTNIVDLRYSREYGEERMASLSDTFKEWKVEFRLVPVGSLPE